MTIITRTNGQPFATESSARQQLTAKGLQGTHEVVTHEGGYALAPKQSEGEAVTLMAGDYVSTKGMTEDQYHAVARAFMGAGFEAGEYPDKRELRGERAFGIDARRDSLFHGRPGSDGSDVEALCGRHLTVAQVLGATSAGSATPQPEETTMTADPITALKQARTTRDEAETAYQAALEAVRNELTGYVLTEVGNDAPLVEGVDMTDPANWREGDVMEVVDESEDTHMFSVGELVTILNASDTNMGKLAPRCNNQAGDDWWVLADNLRFHHRPA